MDSKEKKICITKAELAEYLSDHQQFEKQQSIDFIEDFINLIKSGLEQEGKVMLSGFGSFEVKEKKPRRGRNPQTGESMMLRARKVVKFKPSPILRKAINEASNKSSQDEYSPLG